MTDPTKDIDGLLGYLSICADRYSCHTLPSDVAVNYHAALTALIAERDRLRQCLPPTAHTGILNGPGEGTWSAFALKVVEQRDALVEERNSLVAERDALKQRVAELEENPPADRDLRKDLICAALTGILSNVDFKLNEEDSALCVVAYADATIAAMRKGEP